MCLPALAVVAVVMTVAAAAASAYAQKQAGEMQADIAKRNADIRRKQANDAQLRGQQAETAHRQEINSLVGRQRSAVGASGAVVDTGATAALIEDTEAIGELEALTIRNNAMREAWGHEVASTSILYEGEAALASSRLSAGATLLGGAASATGMASKYR
jgi:hypothetical protein